MTEKYISVTFCFLLNKKVTKFCNYNRKKINVVINETLGEKTDRPIFQRRLPGPAGLK